MTGPDIPHYGDTGGIEDDEDGEDGEDDRSGGSAEPGGPGEQDRLGDPERGPSPADPLAPLVVCPPFRPETVSMGPFDKEPFELQPITWHLKDGTVRPGPDNVRCLAEWLTGALDAAGVTLGAFDRLQAHLIAGDGWGPVQAVAGWITRAHANPHRPRAPRSPNRLPRRPIPLRSGRPRRSGNDSTRTSSDWGSGPQVVP